MEQMEFFDFVRCMGFAVCVAVLLGCICRINALEPGRTRFEWSAAYGLLAIWALGVAIDMLKGMPEWYEAAGMGGLLLYFWLTRHLWKNGPPPATLKG